MPKCPLKKVTYSHFEPSTGRTISEEILGERGGKECAWYCDKYDWCSMVVIAASTDEIYSKRSKWKRRLIKCMILKNLIMNHL